MWLLHSRPSRVDVCAAQGKPGAKRAGSARSALREHLSLHRLWKDPRGGAARVRRDVRPMSVAPVRSRIRGVVGESVERPDAVAKVKGEFQYGSDLNREGMLFGATLRSPHPHARILGIDVSGARRMSGVRAVITSAELPTRELFGLMKLDQPVLATGRVRYAGEPVAIVAADSAEKARVAARAIAVRYDVLRPTTDAVVALQPGAASLHSKGNVIEDVLVAHGDPDARADVVVEGEYELAMQDQAALGPEAGLAIPRRDGGVELHVATQWLHEDLRQIAPCLGPPESKVRLVLAVGAYTNNPPTGAMRGFGAVQSCFAYEDQMDKLAAKLEMDPVVLREKNALRNGDRIVTSQPVEGSAPVAEIVRRCADLPLPEMEIPRDPIGLPGGAGNLTFGEGVRRGTGLAAGMKNVCYSHGFHDFSTARVRLTP